MKHAALALALVLTAAPAFAQLGGLGGKIGKAKEIGDKVADLKVSETDERKIGEAVSTKVRQEFGVYQNAAVTKYVTLVGSVLAETSERPNLKWEFIVLDTDGVNAFAAPGGIVHITRGALGMIKSEAELAGVLGHEVEHVAQKHTVKAIEQSKRIKLGTDVAAGSREWVNALADNVYDDLVENGFDRAQENDADEKGIVLAAKVGYNPSGLGTFLTKLMERNKGESDRNGLFASHPETEGRVDRLNKQIKTDKLAATAMVAPRYTSTITFDVKPIAEVSTVTAGTKGVAGGSSKAAPEEKKEEPKKKGFGLGGLSLSKGKQAESTQANASAGGRAVGKPDRNAKGGDNPAKLAVTVTPAEVAAFKKGIA
ncbi:MAG TPA: M48 family metalloprotease [Aeromicrobium sp.]|nr:M48 family metalloprotease [Aeromicrobium sp.]